ncbi:dihydroorotate dehydrogenase [candidate division LCP-89 bacterium B3_LCP]|uniref:Dihydroorotate dehydrogenase n=1 Tax=candidate division LCP-89 bacterium B3_LCP TaxID=2012998 RepID=A0A532UZF2_UNCL8|nr:MAG: dihydroorotate dehydrogenase [candidate division LCP-89 bacterium B3_LCP]
MIQEKGVVRQVERYRPTIFSLVLELPQIAELAKPGQFVHLKVDGAGILLRRPFSIAGAGDGLISLIIQIVGKGTELLSNLQTGQICDVIGPLGKGFTYQNADAVVLVGGGIGVVPLLMLQDELVKQGKKVPFFLGGQSHEKFPLPDAVIPERNISYCTDDGSFGIKGLVTDLLEKHLGENPSEIHTVYTCGPVPMMRKTDELCAHNSILYQVSLESRMACGIGVCQGCAQSVGGGYKLVCTDGPVFNGADVDWDLIT